MKKHVLAAVAASLMLSSCSNDEVISVPGQAAINFDSFVSKTTRATDASKTNLMNMTVYGYIGDETPVKNFDGQIVSRPDQSTEWGYTPIQYWTADKNYFFTAISSPVSEGNSHYTYTWADNLPIDINADFYGSGTISIDNSKSGGNEDLVYAYATKSTPAQITTSPGKVEFVFKHALSRVKFTFKNAMGSDAYSIKIYDLKITNAATQAELTLGEKDPTWNNHSNTTELTLRNNLFVPANQIALNAASVASGTKFIIPGEQTLNISFNIDLIVYGKTIATYYHNNQEIPTTTFQNGHSYNFLADINPKNIDPEQDMFPIEFNVIDVDGWIEESGIPVTLPESTTPTEE
ncbi:fimbrillin family protein [Xylanibacter muris]|uniref:Fimbrillin family protein n=1 Tax=Xylanibacter muris TaxID=2736290 RepID=A0ABX2AJS7_9BACT|nr:fimbrillin family protein [Xylanibacter muris]NPD91078.1 fimbrillin family protein [Xylanibacter muris]